MDLTDCNIRYVQLQSTNSESKGYLLLFCGLNRLFVSSKVQNQTRMFIGKDNFSCSFLCYIKAMDNIMF